MVGSVGPFGLNNAARFGKRQDLHHPSTSTWIYAATNYEVHQGNDQSSAMRLDALTLPSVT